MIPEDYGRLEQELRAGRTVAAPTRGTSMQPLLYEGQTLVVLMPCFGPLKKGDVALYKRPDGMYVLHRVVRVQAGSYAIRGDNCYYVEQVRPEQVLGVMTEVVRKGKTIRVTDPAYRCYAAVWMAVYPLRAKWRTLRWRLGCLKQKMHPGDHA